MTTTTDDRQPILTPEERGRLWYECGDPDDPPWDSLTPQEQAAWVAEPADDDELWVQWRPGLVQ